tara:strand:+ start:46 stop:1200 length:1155 start_codon:yes stop_codon:yes gene_type:complete
MSRIIVDSLRGNSASSDAISLANDGTCTANITNNLSNRNKVINGAMVVNQRSGTYNRPTGDEYTVDRFETRTGSSFNFDTLTTQDSSAPNGFSKSLKITPQTTQTPSGSHNGMFAHLIEADNLLGFASGTSSAKKFVLSFYAKSASQNNNHQYSVQLSKINSGGNFYYQNRSFTVTSSWQRFTVAFPADTSNNITTGNGEGLRILWHLAAGSDDIASAVTSWTSSNGNHAVTGQSNFMDNTSNEFYLTGVQLEASDSDVATDFEHRSFGQELALCQRYFECSNSYGTVPLTDTGQGIYIQSASSNGAGNCLQSINFKVSKRANPTMTGGGNTLGSWGYGRSGAGGYTTVTFDEIGFNSCRAYNGVGSNHVTCDTYGHWKAEAEL